MYRINTPVELVKAFDTNEVVAVLQALPTTTRKQNLEIAKNLLLELYRNSELYSTFTSTSLQKLFNKKATHAEFSSFLETYSISTNRDCKSEHFLLLESNSDSEYLLVHNGKILTAFSHRDKDAHIENCLIAAMTKELKQLETRYKTVKMYYPRSAGIWVGTAIKVCNDNAITGYTLEGNLIIDDSLMIPTDILRKYVSGRVSGDSLH